MALVPRKLSEALAVNVRQSTSHSAQRPPWFKSASDAASEYHPITLALLVVYATVYGSEPGLICLSVYLALSLLFCGNWRPSLGLFVLPILLSECVVYLTSPLRVDGAPQAINVASSLGAVGVVASIRGKKNVHLFLVVLSAGLCMGLLSYICMAGLRLSHLPKGARMTFDLLRITAFPPVGNRGSGEYLSLALPTSAIVALLSRQATRPREKLFGILGLAIPLVCVVLSLSRGIWLSAFAFAFFGAVRGPSPHFRRWAGTVCAVLLLSIGAILVAGRVQDAPSLMSPTASASRSITGRFSLWSQSAEMLDDKIFLGHGREGFLRRPSDSRDTDQIFTTQPFSLFAKLLIERGCVGAILFIFSIMLLLLKEKEGDPDNDSFIFKAAIICMGIRDLTYCSIGVHSGSTLLFGVLCGLVMRTHPIPLLTNANAQRFCRFSVVALLVVACTYACARVRNITALNMAVNLARKNDFAGALARLDGGNWPIINAAVPGLSAAMLSRVPAPSDIVAKTRRQQSILFLAQQAVAEEPADPAWSRNLFQFDSGHVLAPVHSKSDALLLVLQHTREQSLGNIEKAQALAAQAIWLEPALVDSDWYENLGDERSQLTQRALNIGRTFDSGDYVTSAKLGALLAAQGKLPLAMVHVQRALALSPNSSRLLLLRWSIAGRLGSRDDRDLDLAQLLTPLDGDMVYQRALLDLARGELGLAKGGLISVVAGESDRWIERRNRQTQAFYGFASFGMDLLPPGLRDLVRPRQAQVGACHALARIGLAEQGKALDNLRSKCREILNRAKTPPSLH